MTKVHAKCVDFIDYSFGFKSEKSVYKEIEGKVHFIESKTNLKIAIFNKITNEIVDCFYCLNKDKLKNRFIGIIYFDLKAKRKIETIDDLIVDDLDKYIDEMIKEITSNNKFKDKKKYRIHTEKEALEQIKQDIKDNKEPLLVGLKAEDVEIHLFESILEEKDALGIPSGKRDDFFKMWYENNKFE